MMLGKRSGRPSPAPRRHQQHMRRTTSLTEFAAPDVLADVAEEEEDGELQLLPAHAEAAAAAGDAAEAELELVKDPYGWAIGSDAATADWLAAYRARAAPALAGLRRNSADFSAAETAAFLRACGLCSRRLGPGRDTFMYRGDTAFCSLECRQQHITIEEWKDKCALATPPTAPASDPVAPLPPPGAGAASDKPGTLAAAS